MKKEKLEGIKKLRLNGVMFIPVGEKPKQDVLRAYNLKCWRETKKSGKAFDLNYAVQKLNSVIRIKRTA